MPVRLSREAALIPTSLLAPTVATVLLFVADLSAEQQAAWNAATVAVAGLVTALLVARDKLAPAILGLAQAVLAVLTVYGWGLTAEQSTAVTGLVALLVGAYVRTQVTAPVSAEGRHARPVDA